MDDALILTPGEPDHFRDRLLTTARTILTLAQGKLDSDSKISELIGIIKLLDEDAHALSEALALERRGRFRVIE